MKKMLTVLLFCCAMFIFGCANNAVLSNKIYHNMSYPEFRQAVENEGFGYCTDAIYKGFTLIKLNKRFAMPVYVVLDSERRVVFFDRDRHSKLTASEYLIDVIENKVMYDIKIRNR